MHRLDLLDPDSVQAFVEEAMGLRSVTGVGSEFDLEPCHISTNICMLCMYMYIFLDIISA